MNTLSRRETIIQFLDAMLQPEQPSDKPNECRCHIVDPSKNTILIFTCSDPKHSDSLIVKFNGQKFIALPRQDKNGAKYWKVRDFYEVEQKALDLWEAKMAKAGFTLEEPNELVKSYQEKVAQKRPMSEFSMAEIKAYNKWTAEQKAQVNSEPKIEIKDPVQEEVKETNEASNQSN